MIEGAVVEPAMSGATPSERPDRDANYVPNPYIVTDAQGRFDVWGMPEGVPIALTVDAEGYEIRVFPLDGPTDHLELEVRKVGPAVRQRLHEIQAELKRIRERQKTADDDAEHQTLDRQREALRRESKRIRREKAATADGE